MYHAIFVKKTHLGLNALEKMIFAANKAWVSVCASEQMCRCSGTNRCARDKTDAHIEP